MELRLGHMDIGTYHVAGIISFSTQEFIGDENIFQCIKISSF